jgi:hypothetical protein
MGFEPKIPASERPQTHALDRAATGTGSAESEIQTSSLFNDEPEKKQAS